MEINQILRLAEHAATGRYIGAGRDKSGPTAVRIISLICINGLFSENDPSGGQRLSLAVLAHLGPILQSTMKRAT